MKKSWQWLLGKPRNPMAKDVRRHISLIAFLAWIGLGADGLSSANYGPQEAFYALRGHEHMALYLAIATALTVFLISSAYNQVIKLFPNGGGGYKVASHLLGPYAGLVSGMALIIDYVLTIAISIASGVDALFSLLPLAAQEYKLLTEALILVFLWFINLRGAKESIKILMPIFLGFFIVHLILIVYGITAHGGQLPRMLSITVQETQDAVHSLGWLAVLAIFIRAYSMGAGTYTGLEAVSNNVNMLAEPRVQTGRWTMFYMALSLSVVAGGIIILYLLWGAHYVPGKTLNAVVFGTMLNHWPLSHFLLTVVLLTEAGILFVASNTGFLGGPAVLANMAVDNWVPKRFSLLSSRLVTQNSVIFIGLAALVILLGTDGRVSFLVVLYSINVFLTFSMSLLGLTCYWLRVRRAERHWCLQLILSVVALVVCVSILMITLVAKFELGGWITVLVTALAVVCGLLIRRHYRRFAKLKKKLNHELHIPLVDVETKTPELKPKQPTAVFLVNEIGAAMHALLWVQRMFPDYYKNFVFISHAEVDMGSFGSDEELKKLKKKTSGVLDYLVKYSQQHGFGSESYVSFGTDAIDHIYNLAKKVNKKYSNAIYFASRYVYPDENWFTRVLHSDLSTIIQRRLHLLGIKMLILPLNLKV